MPDRAIRTGSGGGVVITGIGAVASLGVDTESIWRAVLAKKCGIGGLSEIESSLPPGSDGGQAQEIPPEYRPDLPREARFLRWTIEHALRDADLSGNENVGSTRWCAVLGTTLHGIRAGGRFLRSGRMEDLATFLAGTIAQLAIDDLGIGGGAITTCSACSSSLGAIALGVTLLESGHADVVIAGGYDAISEYSWAGFNALRLIAPGPLRPFCRDRQGMKVAEGYGIVVLERADDAVRRGARSHARLAGWGESADSHHLTLPHPQGEGALAAMQQALDRAAVPADQLGMIAAHATGTPENDAAEYAALDRLLGASLSIVPVVGFKSFLGHTLGGAGAVELVLSCLALRDQTIPACPNVAPKDVEFPRLVIPAAQAVSCELRSTLNTSLGFGGANTCVVLKDMRSAVTFESPPESSYSARSAVITGVGIILPGAIGHAAFARIARGETTVSGDQFVHTISDSDLEDYLNVRRARRLSEYVKLTLAAANMAIRDAGLSDCPRLISGASAMLASMHGSATFCADYYSQIVKEGVLSANPVLFAEGVPNAAAAHLSTSLGVRGACQTIIGSRCAGLDALGLATLRIQTGAVDVALVVAAEERNELVDKAYRAAGLMAEHTQATVLARDRGFNRSFGGVAFIVESEASAINRGAQTIARVLGYASGSPRSHGAPQIVSSIVDVMSRLPGHSRVIGSPSGTWIDRAERLAVRRFQAAECGGSCHSRFGELFSATPLVGLAAELAQRKAEPRLTVLCTDWSGAVSAVLLDGMRRRIGISEPQSEPTP